MFNMDLHDHQLPVVGDFSESRRWLSRVAAPGARHIRLISLGVALLLLVPLAFAAVYLAHSPSKPTGKLLNSQATKQLAVQTSDTASTGTSPSSSKSSSNAPGSAATTAHTNSGSTASMPTSSGAGSSVTPSPQTSWAACTNGGLYKPLSDAAAAALVTHQPEIRKYNATPFSINGVSYQATNQYVPTDAELSRFESATNQYGQTTAQGDPYLQYVDGRDGLSNPSTDDLIQWAAHKWGIPEDWLRAEYAQESYWNMWNLGDRTAVSASWYSQYPVQSQIPNSSDVYQSLGITQVRWAPDNSLGIGTEPLRWKSMAFNIDFQAATIRFYYDNPDGTRTAWGDASYTPCQQWNSIGGWYNPYPWNNSGQASYVTKVQQYLSERIWTTSSFTNFTPSTPSDVVFH